jgi:outer membrane protein assembly factor BamB
VAGGRVLIGTNNEPPRDSRNPGDRGVLLCLDEKDGKVLWHLAVPKQDDFNDWPRVGIVSPPTVDGDRVYVLSNRGEVLCLDLNGQIDGNDGPFRDEGRHMVPRGEPALEVRKDHADIIWIYDMVSELGVTTHDQTHGSVLLHGDFLYVPTSNGVDGSHKLIPAPDAPSLIVLEKKSGRLVATDGANIGPQIVHCMWSSPSLGKVGGRELVFFGGSNAICYAFEALTSLPPDSRVRTLKEVWRFDCDPAGPRGDLPKYQDNLRVGPSTIIGMPVFHRGRVYVAAGGDVWHGKLNCWMKCIDATKTGDITASGEVWSSPLKRHSMSTPSIHEGLVYIADCGRQVSCLDAQTGQVYWVHRASGDFWGSTLVADDKIYVGSRRGDFWILATGKEYRVLDKVQIRGSVNATPTAANGVLYVATMHHLYAIRRETK